MEKIMVQRAPYPAELDDLVSKLAYRPGWRFELKHMERDEGCEGLTFVAYTLGYDTYHPENGETYGVFHYFPVPPATYNRQSWQRWLFDRVTEIEGHECCEFFQIGGGRPFAPNHGPGWNPYGVRELNAVEAAETTFRGERREGTQA